MAPHIKATCLLAALRGQAFDVLKEWCMRRLSSHLETALGTSTLLQFITLSWKQGPNSLVSPCKGFLCHQIVGLSYPSCSIWRPAYKVTDTGYKMTDAWGTNGSWQEGWTTLKKQTERSAWRDDRPSEIKWELTGKGTFHSHPITSCSTSELKWMTAWSPRAGLVTNSAPWSLTPESLSLLPGLTSPHDSPKGGHANATCCKWHQGRPTLSWRKP